MSGLSSHVLDTALGQPARDLRLRLDLQIGVAGQAIVAGEGWRQVATGMTNADGRVADVLGGAPLELGIYRLTFETGPYFRATGQLVFYPWVEVIFAVTAAQHHHIPLLLSPFGYTTYRGS